MATRQWVHDPLGDPKNGLVLTRAIIDTIHEPLIVLDEDLHIIVASRSFYKKFNQTRALTQGKYFYKIGKGEWNIPQLRKLLGSVISKHKVVEGFEVKLNLPYLGIRTLLLNAREIIFENGQKKMLLSIFDISEQRALEAVQENLLTQKDLLLKEMRHRIANSLQLIASILILKAGMVKSEETRFQLEDAHSRIMSVATVQSHLDPSTWDGSKITIGIYLTALCQSLAKSMIGGRKPITLNVTADKATATSEEAISFGLITTELVINSLKHAFPNNRKGKITVAYTARGSAWKLVVTDDGVGFSRTAKNEHSGLGTGIVSALAHQMHATIKTTSTGRGTSVSIIHTPIKKIRR